MPSGGDIGVITCIHPDLGTFEFNAKAGVDSTYTIGGLLTDDTDTDIDASGSPMYKINQKRASFGVDISWYMGDGTLEALSALSASPNEGQWSFPNVGSGIIYRLTGKPVGDYSGNGNTSTITLKVAGNPRTFQII